MILSGGTSTKDKEVKDEKKDKDDQEYKVGKDKGKETPQGERKKSKKKKGKKKKKEKEDKDRDTEKEKEVPTPISSPSLEEEEDEREVISVLDKFLAQKQKENEQRLKAAEELWDLPEDVEKEDDKAITTQSGNIMVKSPSEMKWKVKIFVVVNRLSGKGKKAKVDEVLRREGGFRWKWDIFYIQTGKEDMASEVREKVLKERKYDWVFACGGDGTVSSLVSLLSGTDIPLGVIPLGTGNAFAQEMKIPLKWKNAVRMISHHHVRRTLVPRPVDCMQMGSRYYMLTIDIGIGAKTVEDAANHPERKRRLGVWAYLISATKAITHQEPVIYKVTIDGETVEMRATEVVLCNAGMVGMGHDIRWGPGISVDDGAIDLVFIEATSVADYVSVIKALGTGETSKNKRIKYLRASQSIEISSEQEAPVAADGDLIGSLPISVKIICGAVKVLLPQFDKASKNNSAIF